MTTSNWYNFAFVQNAISNIEISNQLNQFSNLFEAGAYTIFLGQVRKDKVEDKIVSGIEYTTNKEMAEAQFEKICSDAKDTFQIQKVSILHSLDIVNIGELCLMVIVACGHRKECYNANEYIVERLKKEVPIWGKEIFTDNSHQWKVNNF